MAAYDAAAEIRWLGSTRICQIHLKDRGYLGQGIVLCLLLVWMGIANGAEFGVSGGAVHNQVFQRDSENRAQAPLRGEGPEGALVEARVTRHWGVLPGFDWTPVATVQQGRWSGVLTDLPAGGPFRIELRAGGMRAAIENVLVGDLWILAGQSNMEGDGNLAGAEPPHELVHSFDLADHWVVAEEPLHTLANAADRVHWPRNSASQPERWEGERLRRLLARRRKGAGPALPFAVERVRRTGVPVGLIPCAHGGTSMDEWDPAGKTLAGDSLYGSMYRRFRAAGGRVAGVLWYQGEADAKPKLAEEYQGKFERLISAIRADFRMPGLPFYYVQLGRHVNHQNEREWNLIQESQRLVEQRVPGVGMVASIDLEMDDAIHIGADGLKILGRRLAISSNGGGRGPRPVRATATEDVIRLVLSCIRGRLMGQGRLAGFSVTDSTGRLLPRIYRIEVDPADGTRLLLRFDGRRLPAGALLWYGYGKDPYCNLQDSAGMALPVFGPLSIEQ